MTKKGTKPAAAPTGAGRGPAIEEPLLFEQGSPEKCGVDLPPADLAPNLAKDRLGGIKRTSAIGLPGLSEPEVVRHFTRLSQRNYGIDTGIYPLGSCTMKHNPRLNERLARLPGFAGLHPLQPESTVQGALELMDTLARWLAELTGLPTIALSPAAGAHGEFCGLMAIRAAHEAKGDVRRRVLVPDSAHGTNPATTAACGYQVEAVPSDAHGRLDLAAFEQKLGTDVAALMLTNPNTCGLFENDILKIAAAVHAVGAYVYCDGANFNAIAGRVRPADLGIDCIHLNLHKTFSTPHGGGGPGSGPVAFSEGLAPYAPVPLVVRRGEKFTLIERIGGDGGAAAFGRMLAFHGQFGTFVRALAYILSLGGDGIKRMAEDAVIAANYLRERLKDSLTPAYPGPCMHEVLFDDRFLKGTGVGTLDFAKAMIDEGIHPMTIYFPLIVSGALLVEPTETESRDSLDRFIETMAALAARARAGDAEFFLQAPRHAPRRRLDETGAARKPVLRWKPPADKDAAAE